MRIQPGKRLLFAVLAVHLASGCRPVQQPLECDPGGEFPFSQAQRSPRASSAEPLVITGTLLGPDGAALVDHPLALGKKPTAQDWLALFFAAPLVLADCLTIKSHALCEGARAGRTDARSAFRFEVDDEPVDGEHGFELYSELPATGTRTRGPYVSRAVWPRGQHLAAGETRFWDPALTLVRQTDRLLVTAADDRCRGDETVELVSETGDAWFQVRGGEVDDALLDDAPLGVRLAANVETTRYASGVEPLAEPRVPPSRGAPCTVTRPDGTQAVQRPCLLTDGRGTALGSEVVSVEVALPAVQSGTVAVRGYGALRAKLEVSSDGTSWQTVAEEVSSSQVVRAGGPGRPAVRALRLSPSEGQRHPGRIFEVLVW